MTIAPSDLARASAAPVLATGGLRTLDLTTSDATIDLAAGAYEAHNGGSALAVLSLTEVTTALPPATGVAERLGALVVPAGGVGAFAIDAPTTLHAKTLTGTGTLYLHRKAAL